MKVGQGPIELALGVVWTFLPSSILSLLFLPLSTVRYRMKYCLTLSQRAVKPETTNQPAYVMLHIGGLNEALRYHG